MKEVFAPICFFQASRFRAIYPGDREVIRFNKSMISGFALLGDDF